MLTGVWYAACILIIAGPALLLVGLLAAAEWIRSLLTEPRTVTSSLVALTLALVPDVVMLINPWTKFIREIPNDNNIQLFTEWQAVSGFLIIAAVLLSVFEKRTINKFMSLCGSLVLFLIHGAGTAIFFWGV